MSHEGLAAAVKALEQISTFVIRYDNTEIELRVLCSSGTFAKFMTKYYPQGVRITRTSLTKNLRKAGIKQLK